MLSATEAHPAGVISATDYAKRKLAILLILVFVLMIFLEGFTRRLHDHRKITLTVEQSIADALAIRPVAGKKQTLFIGNSLIFMDVTQPALQDAMGPDYLVHTAGVVGSTYYDWQFGFRALFNRGSRPDIVVFAISPSQYIRAASVTPMIVSHLWTNSEILAYRRDQNLNLTTFAELLFERYSTFFALRDVVRIYVRKVIPGFIHLVGLWGRPTPSKPMENQAPTTEIYVRRLRPIMQTMPPGTRFVLLIPPTNQPSDTAAEPYLRAAARELGISVEEPVNEYQWPSTKFQPDAYHLDNPAAIEFSRLVGPDIARLDDSTASNPANATPAVAAPLPSESRPMPMNHSLPRRVQHRRRHRSSAH